MVFRSTPHASKDLIVDMLDGKIEVRADLLLLGNEFQKPFGEMACLWIAVKDTDPTEPSYVDEIFEELFQIGSVFHIPPVGGCVLGNEDDLPDTSIGKPFSLVEDGSKFSAPIGSPDHRHRAEGAGIGAALGDLQISQIRRRGEDSWRPLIIKKGRFREKTFYPLFP
jgi:hypothetical protein